MKKLLLLFIAIAAMTGTSNAQAGSCTGSRCTISLDCGVSPDCANPDPQIFCNGFCTDFNTDPNNCGGTGSTCAPGEVCSGGSCTCFGDPKCNDVSINSRVHPKPRKIARPFVLKPRKWTQL